MTHEPELQALAVRLRARMLAAGLEGQTDLAEDLESAALIVERQVAAKTEIDLGLTLFQDRVQPWMMACFGEEISADVCERGDRFLEEALELLQSHGYDPGRVATLRDYVWGRPVGEPAQEVGGVMITLAAYCLATGVNMHAAGEEELQRIWTMVEKIRAKQAGKRGLHTPLPVATTRQSMSGIVEGCSCERCWPNSLFDMRMILCEQCGNKRCPHATDHRHACTGSNEPGQKGSSWETFPKASEE